MRTGIFAAAIRSGKWLSNSNSRADEERGRAARGRASVRSDRRGMAAAPDASGTRFGFLGGITAPGVTLLHPLLHLVVPAAVRLDRLQTDVQRHLDQQ
jgi:hypothetical protein